MKLSDSVFPIHIGQTGSQRKFFKVKPDDFQPDSSDGKTKSDYNKRWITAIIEVHKKVQVCLPVGG